VNVPSMSPPADTGPRANVLHAALVDLGVSYIVGIPDNASAVLFDLILRDPSMSLVPATREGEAFAIASGLWLGGRHPAVIIQNTGLLESGDSLRGTAVRMGVPLLCLIGYRGYAKMKEAHLDPHAGPPTRTTLTQSDVDSVALLTEPTLRAWGIPYHLYSTDDDAPLVAEAWAQAHREARPVALLLTHASS